MKSSKKSSKFARAARRATDRKRKTVSWDSICESLEYRRLLTGTWSTTTNLAPSYAQMGMVLTDGSLLVHASTGSQSSTWEKLTPSSNGNYSSGTWTTVASSNVSRLYTASEVMQNGKVLVVGGEYASDTSFSKTGEIYDPVANTWTNITPFPQNNFGDDPTELMPNGNVLAGYISGSQTYIYNPTTNAWSTAATKLRGDQSDEESWVTLPDHSILSYDVWSSVSLNVPHAQRYIPSTNTWVDAGNPPAQLSAASVGYEMGPALMLPDGRAFFAGGTNATAYYTPSTNSWTAGPNMPNGYVMADAPGAVLPNGNLLLAMSPRGGISGGNYNFPGPTLVYELNPTTNVYTNVTPGSTGIPALSGFSFSGGSYGYSFTTLPTGQIAMMDFNTRIAIYTESGTPVAAAVPVINGITYGGTTGVYTLSGTNLNGINEGASYGDDNEMASNYPLVRLIDSSGNVTYARTTNWSLTGVFQGAETVTFTLPSSDTAGAYLLQSVANGVASATMLAVLVNAHTTTSAGVASGALPTAVNVVGNGAVLATFATSSFSSIEIVGDNSGDTLSVNVNNNLGTIPTTVQGGSGTDTININQTSATGYAVIAPSAGADAVNVGTTQAINGAATAIAQFLVSQQIGVLTVGSGGVTTVVPGGTKKVLQTNGVITTGTGILDLTSNDMIVHLGDLPTLTSEIAAGYNLSGGVPQSGAGILSSTAAGDTTQLTALGIIQNTDGVSALYTTFDGQPAVQSDVLIKFTYLGDANLDGKVDGSDYSLIDNGLLTNASGWANGDFDYNGQVDGSDYTLIDNAYNVQGASLAAEAASQAAISAKSKLHAKASPNAFVTATAVNSAAVVAIGNQSTSAAQPPLADEILQSQDSIPGLEKSDALSGLDSLTST